MAASRGRLRAQKGSDGQWRGSRAVNEYRANRQLRRTVGEQDPCDPHVASLRAIWRWRSRRDELSLCLEWYLIRSSLVVVAHANPRMVDYSSPQCTANRYVKQKF